MRSALHANERTYNNEDLTRCKRLEPIVKLFRSVAECVGRLTWTALVGGATQAPATATTQTPTTVTLGGSHVCDDKIRRK